MIHSFSTRERRDKQQNKKKRKTSYCPTLVNITEFRTDLKVMGKKSSVRGNVCTTYLHRNVNKKKDGKKTRITSLDMHGKIHSVHIQYITV